MIKIYLLPFVRSVVAHPRRAALILLAVCLPLLVLTASFFSDIRAGLEELLLRLRRA